MVCLMYIYLVKYPPYSCYLMYPSPHIVSLFFSSSDRFLVYYHIIILAPYKRRDLTIMPVISELLLELSLTN